MVDSVEPGYLRLVEAVRHPTKDNWPFRYDQGLRLQRVAQGRRLVAETPVLPELKFMLDLENPTAKDAYGKFVSGRGNLVRFAAAWSDPDWKFPAGRTPDSGLGDSAESIRSRDGAVFDSALKAPLTQGHGASSVPQDD
jgi:hypothetical protein